MQAVDMTVRNPTIFDVGPDSAPSGNPVVARNWRLALVHDRLTLTGLYGFRWPGPVLEARCLRKDPAQGDLLRPRRMVDRYHPVVPDPSCTCGIYGSTDPDQRWSARPLLRSEPIVIGFIELSGRIFIEDDGVFRAHRATVRGPLQIIFPQPRFRRRACLMKTNRIVDSEGRLTLARSSARGLALGDWLKSARAELAERYQTEVL